MLPLHTHAVVRGVNGTGVFKVISVKDLHMSDIDRTKCLLWIDNSVTREPIKNLAGVVFSENSTPIKKGCITVEGIRTAGVIRPGDVIRLTEEKSLVSVLYRRGSNSNTLFATERCNSFCLMCSQPPRDIDDRWRVDEMLQVIDLVDSNEQQLGISGGEPTLLGDDLIVLLHHAKSVLPNTELHILSNGRKFSDVDFVRTISAVHHPSLTWGIPLYAAGRDTHDYIVQALGAWDETIQGLYNLARHHASIELRVVVQRENIDHIGELASFIFRNLAFVGHVAFMGLEPMGFARKNHDSLWIDPADCAESLQDAVFFLENRGIKTSIYNFPLCTLPEDLWPFCTMSISDWKNVYLPSCATCDVRHRCGGFFQSINDKWISRLHGPITASQSQSSRSVEGPM